jgi:hypothetical protein
MSNKELNAQLAVLVSEFEAALSKAECFAMEHNLSFHITPTYGMGGTYDGTEGEWFASSQSC